MNYNNINKQTFLFVETLLFINYNYYKINYLFKTLLPDKHTK